MIDDVPEVLVVAHEVPLLNDGALPEGVVVAPFCARCPTRI